MLERFYYQTGSQHINSQLQHDTAQIIYFYLTFHSFIIKLTDCIYFIFEIWVLLLMLFPS